MSSHATAEQLDKEKVLAARAALRWVRSGMTLGLGSGSTAAHFIRALGEQVRNGALAIEAVASSQESEAAARAQGIPIVKARRGMHLDLDVDGADEITPQLDLLKGRGGALLREKVLAQASRYFLVIADSSKLVERLGQVPAPVEVVPFTLPWVADRIEAIGGRSVLRSAPHAPDQPYLTDQQNYILDCTFPSLEDPAAIAAQLKQIPGVVEHGLFLGCSQAAVIGKGSDVFVLLPGKPLVPLAEFPLPG